MLSKLKEPFRPLGVEGFCWLVRTVSEEVVVRASRMTGEPAEDFWWGAPVMIDLEPTQFLTDGERLTALIDTEAYAIGPRELDFINLEFIIGPTDAAAITRGYSSLLPIPVLTAVRPVYRYLLRLLSVQGSVRLERWLDWPALF